MRVCDIVECESGYSFQAPDRPLYNFRASHASTDVSEQQKVRRWTDCERMDRAAITIPSHSTPITAHDSYAVFVKYADHIKLYKCVS